MNTLILGHDGAIAILTLNRLDSKILSEAKDLL